MNKDTVYHFVGIKGSGMSALALILHGEGYQVQGSDVAQYIFTQQSLEDHDIPIYEFDASNIQPGQTIIAGNAFGDDHEELVRARELGLPIYRYHKFLGELINNYISFAVTGSHGKTSTTGILSHCLSKLSASSYLIGDGTGFGDEGAEYFALEACEYRRHFLAYQPEYAIITNVDFDHPDYYESIHEVFQAMVEFASGVKKAVIACGEDTYLANLELSVPIYFYGFSEKHDLYANNIRRQTEGSIFDIHYRGQTYKDFYLPLFGQHNILNMLGVILALQLEGFDIDDINQAMKDYGGVKRRFSNRQVDDLIIIDDYAHHPQEIKATIDAAHQKYPDRDIVAIFQPHTFSRTVALLDDFAEALNEADQVYLVDIFSSAREAAGQVNIQALQKLVKGDNELISSQKLGPLMHYRDQVLIFMGAGDIDDISRQFEQAYHSLNLSAN